MVNKNDTRRTEWGSGTSDPLEHELNKVLARYAAVEPRAGLHERVLANLRTQPPQAETRWLWPCSVAVAAAVVIVVIALTWRVGRPAHPAIADHPSTTSPSAKEPAAQIVANGRESAVHSPKPAATRTIPHQPHPVVATAANPRLDQFPSPQQLSEQERILANYVAEYPQHAVLIARARMAALQRDEEEEQQDAVAVTEGDSQSR
jgi:hypothetical protein